MPSLFVSIYGYLLQLLGQLVRSFHILNQPPDTAMAVPKEGDRKEVYLLHLTDLGAPDVQNEYIYLPPPTDPPYDIRFEIEGTSSICRQGTLWTNIPQVGKRFRRNEFQQFKYVF